MTRRSLRFRLLITSAVSISAALIIAGFGLVFLFQHHVERRIDAELETHLRQIIANMSFTDSGRITSTRDLADPRFRQPLSGLYWQIQDEGRPTILRSRSLWDAVMELPGDRLAPGIVHRHALSGPAGQSLLVRERQIMFGPPSEARRLRVAVAIDKRDLLSARHAFARDILPYLGVLALVLILAAWFQVKIGLVPLDAVRRGVSAIRSGASVRLAAEYPDEVTPLVEEMNALLHAQALAIERARAWTADLAHGLKTPLMVLSADSQRLRALGNTTIADDLDQLADTMRRRVDRELIRARVRSGVRLQQARADTGGLVERVVRTLRRTPAGADLNWTVQAPDGLFAMIVPDDLAELVGNLLENATKWARREIRITVEAKDAVVIRIEDDGIGVADDQLANLGRRGTRLDEQTQGSGLGLAIARDITDAYEGSLSFDHASTGGLAVSIRIPACG